MLTVDGKPPGAEVDDGEDGAGRIAASAPRASPLCSAMYEPIAGGDVTG